MRATPADARRRWFSVLFLIIAAGMLIWGQTLLKPYLEGVGFVIYWLVCMVFTALSMWTALLDIWAVRRRTRNQHRDLLQQVFEEREPDREDKAGKSDE